VRSSSTEIRPSRGTPIAVKGALPSGVALYATAWEHLADELRHLDLVIQRQVLERGRAADSPLEQLKGLVISEEEVASLLSPRPEPPAAERRETGPFARLTEAAIRARRLIDERLRASVDRGVQLTLPLLSRLFQLSPLEEQCLIVCLGPEVDRKYDKLYAYLHDDVTRKKPTVDLVLHLLCRSAEERLAARAIFEPAAPLIRYALVQIASPHGDDPAPLLSRSLKLDDGITDLLLGFRWIHPRLEAFCRLSPVGARDLESAPPEVVDRLQSSLRAYFGEASTARKNLVFHVRGPYGAGKRALAAAAAETLGLPLLTAEVRKLPSDTGASLEPVRLLAREAFLQPAVLCVEGFDVLLAKAEERPGPLAALLESIEELSRVTFLVGGQSWRPEGHLGRSAFIEVDLGLPDDVERAGHWQRLASARSPASGIDLGTLAGKFRFTPGQIRDALDAAQTAAGWRDPRLGTITEQDLYAACRAISRPRLVALTRRVEPRHGWDDIVLPPDAHTQLREICAQARHRSLVFGEWGFGRKLSLGKGLSALFSGPPGTGKTMAAEIIARELGLDLFKIDLSQVVSKYIGETEKNLDKTFAAAEHGNAILFFDEADALFGKRSEVRDSHDRYANVEISYLLQKMEEYEGISILATNLKQHLDEAFLRRLQGIVEFPFPDADYRERIWRVVFPPETPLGEDVDFSRLAPEIKLAGGNIKNIALAAAFLAAEGSGVVHTAHLLHAARREYQKLGRSWSGREPIAQGALA